ncbi:MAG: response regulator [Acidobacteriota bacterium]
MSDVGELTVLVVDDEPQVQIYLQTVLEDAGFRVELAANGKQALDRMQEKEPDVISLDLVMPKMSGLKFYEYIQKNPKRAGIPVVVVTAHGKDEMGSVELKKMLVYKAKGAPVQLLEKPVKPDEYVNTIRKALGLEPLDFDLDENSQALRVRLFEKIKSADKETLKVALRALEKRDS